MAARSRGASLAVMNETSLTLVLELSLDHECLRGSITSASGDRREFAGRLGLIGVIDDLLPPQGDAGQTPPRAISRDKESS
jgi:hypothetical protein